MKIWLKYLIGCILGIIVAVTVPFDSQLARNLLTYITDFTFRFGRYTLLPLLFFSMTLSVYKLRDSGTLLKTAWRTTSAVILGSALLTVFGIISGLLVKLPRIPISVEKISESFSLDIPQRIMQLMPYSAFDVFSEAAYLLPLYIFAGFAGAGCASDKIAAKPLITLFDSISRVSYAVMSFFIDMLSIGFIAVSCSWMIAFSEVLLAGTFNSLILLLAVDFLLIFLVLYPVILRFIFKEMHPYRVMYASLAPVLTSLFSGDTNLTLAVNIRHAKESLGIQRRLNAVTLPIFSTFSRGGSALVTSVSLIVILRSYSSLGISFHDILWIAGASFIVSFFLGALPSGGPFIALTILCALYGKGFDTGYLLLKPAAPIICAFAAAIDAATAMTGSYILAVKMKMIEHQDLRHFI